MLQHMENATVGSNLEVRLASNIRQESVTSFLQYLYEGFMMLTEENYKDVEKIGKLLQVDSVTKCCIDFEKCLTQKTGMPESINTRNRLREHEDSIHVRTTDLLKVQESEKRSRSDSNFSTPESKRQRTMTTPPPPLLLPMLNLAQGSNDRSSMRRDYIQDFGSLDTNQISMSQVPQMSPHLQSQTRRLDLVQDGIEIIHREPPDPNHSQSSQAIQQTMGISVASQKITGSIPQVVNVGENLPPKRSSLSTILSSPRLNAPASELPSTSNLSPASSLPVQERRVSTGSIPIDSNIPKTVDWAQNKSIESRRQFIHPTSSAMQFTPPQPENFHKKLTEFYAAHMQQHQQQALHRVTLPPAQGEGTASRSQAFRHSPQLPSSAQSGAPTSTVRHRLQPKLTQQSSVPGIYI